MPRTTNSCLKQFDHKTRVFSLVLWGFSIGAVSYLSLVPDALYPVEFRWSDKIYHILAYGWLSVLPLIGFYRSRHAFTGALFMLALGVLLELAQAWIPSRVVSIADTMANAVGVGAGTALGHRLRFG